MLVQSWFHPCQADSRPAAAEFLRQHDAALANGARIHRVSEFFAGHNTGSLRSDMESWANGEPLSQRLRTELTAYQLAPLDDSLAEGPHAHVSHTVKAKAASKPFYGH